MGLSRMEQYLAVIKVLENEEPITRKQIMRKAGFNVVSSEEFFNFLVNLDLIREKTLGPKVVYFITNKGQRLCAYFGLNDEDEIFGGTGIFRID